jgi:hypothetical protein
VCELDGPGPILNKSKTEVVMDMAGNFQSAEEVVAVVLTTKKRKIVPPLPNPRRGESQPAG